MPTVTNGTIEYERVVRPADFESKRFKVSLSFAIDDGSDPAAATAQVADLAVAEVHRRLGIKSVEVWKEAEAEADREDGKKRNATMEIVPTAADPLAITEPAQAVPEENPPMTAVVEKPASEIAATAAPSETDPLAITEPEPVAEADISDKPLSDKDLHAAIHQAMGHKVANAEVKKVIAEFTGKPGMSVTLVPQEKRRAFVAAMQKTWDKAA